MQNMKDSIRSNYRETCTVRLSLKQSDTLNKYFADSLFNIFMAIESYYMG